MSSEVVHFGAALVELRPPLGDEPVVPGVSRLGCLRHCDGEHIGKKAVAKPVIYSALVNHHWSEFLRGPAPSGHAVHLYTDHADLVESVAAFVASGFNVGAPAVLVATPEHTRSIRAQLNAAGWGDAGDLLVVSDAATTLDAILEDGAVSAS